MPLKPRYRRCEGIGERRVDDVVFLVNRDNEALYHLNSVGAALWRLLEQGTDGEEAAEILIQAFPDAVPANVRADIENLLAELADHRLIEALKR